MDLSSAVLSVQENKRERDRLRYHERKHNLSEEEKKARLNYMTAYRNKRKFELSQEDKENHSNNVQVNKKLKLDNMSVEELVARKLKESVGPISISKLY